jgi:hypothetical protein
VIKEIIQLPQGTMTEKIWLPNLVTTKIFDRPTLKKFSPPTLSNQKNLVALPMATESFWSPQKVGLWHLFGKSSLGAFQKHVMCPPCVATENFDCH